MKGFLASLLLLSTTAISNEGWSSDISWPAKPFRQNLVTIPKATASPSASKRIPDESLPAACSPERGRSRQSEIALKEDVYSTTPFSQGELATYNIYYMKILVGYGHLQVMAPVLYQNEWVQHFSAHASTGDWYSAFFVAKDRAMAYSHPKSFAVRKFYLAQDEGRIFGERLIQEKWLNFKQEVCLVEETIRKKGKSPVEERMELAHGAADALGAAYKLRVLDYSDNKTKKILVYSSGKNWWLEAIPLGQESVTTPAGTFKAYKIRLQTFLGQELQQKGDVMIWIASLPPNQLVKIEGKIKIGSVNLELSTYRPGKPREIKASASKP